MDYEKLIKLDRISDLKSDKSIILPINHGGYMEPRRIRETLEYFKTDYNEDIERAILLAHNLI